MRQAVRPPPPEAATPAPTPSASRSPRTPSSAGAASPPFGRLVAAALQSAGVEFVTLDHLRKAKKNALNEREYTEMWKLVHDLVLVILLDFEVDFQALRLENAAIDTAHLPLWQELARAYLHEWGFVCASFYSDAVAPPASVVLLAVAWLFAHSRFFERQCHAILSIYVNAPTAMLPPYPNDVKISPAAVGRAVESVSADAQQLRRRLDGEFDLSARLHQLQILVGRIHAHHRSLQSSLEQYERMIARLEHDQRKNGAVEADEVIPAYALQVFASGKRQLELHMRVLTERLQMIEDEKLFYKWINGVVLQYEPGDLEARNVLESQQSELCADILHAQTALKRSSDVYQRIAGLYTSEKTKWQQKTKTRTQQVKMDGKMNKLKHEIVTNELVDVQTLFLDRKRESKPKAQAKSIQFVQESDLLRLQNQLEKVMHEITTEYCRAELI